MIRIVKLTFKEEFVQDFMQLFSERKEKIRNVKGCQHLELWCDKTNRTIFYTYSIWDDEMDLTNYRESDLFDATWSTVKQWFAEKPTATSLDKLFKL
jgi:(4S)-4-hydroxy-5-phosphonooxypentane-2,3-dione isomerase